MRGELATGKMERRIQQEAGRSVVNAFRLQPYEHGIGGVDHRDGVLRLLPSRGATGLALYGTLFSLLAVFAGIALEIVLAVPIGIALGVPSVRYLFCRVVAAEATITVVNKWQRYTVPLDGVVAAVVEDFRPSLGFLPFSGPTTLWPRRLAACFLTLRDGRRIRCDALVGLITDGLAPNPTIIETKAAILRRWIEATQE